MVVYYYIVHLRKGVDNQNCFHEKAYPVIDTAK
jgi:hypothetical protein